MFDELDTYLWSLVAHAHDFIIINFFVAVDRMYPEKCRAISKQRQIVGDEAIQETSTTWKMEVSLK